MEFPKASSISQWCNQFGGQQELLEVDSRPGFVFLPPGDQTPRPLPWVWYAPVIWGNGPAPYTHWIFARLRERQFAVAGVDVGESHGSPAGRKVFTAFHQAMI